MRKKIFFVELQEEKNGKKKKRSMIKIHNNQ